MLAWPRVACCSLFTGRLPTRQTTIQCPSLVAARTRRYGRHGSRRNAGPLPRFGIADAELPIRPHVSAFSRFFPGAGIVVQSENCRGTHDSAVLIPSSETSKFSCADRCRARILRWREWNASFSSLCHAAALPEPVAGDRRLDQGWRSPLRRHRTVSRFSPHGTCAANTGMRAAPLSISQVWLFSEAVVYREALSVGTAPPRICVHHLGQRKRCRLTWRQLSARRRRNGNFSDDWRRRASRGGQCALA